MNMSNIDVVAAFIGFEPPAKEIIPNSEEVIDGLIAMIAEARALNYF